MIPKRTKVFFDGGCRPNPGPIEVAVVVRGRIHVFEDMGHGSNSDAEWLALIQALHVSQSLGLSHVELIGDAREIIGQAQVALQTGTAALAGHAATFLSLAQKSPPSRVRWIKRAQNLAGIALAARHPR